MKRPVPFLLACGLAATAWHAAAAPLKRADLPANPAWVLHLDCDALRQAFFGKYLVYELDKPELNSNMVAFQSTFGFDLRTQLHGLTVYSDDLTPRDNVFLLYADLVPDHIIKLVEAKETVEITKNNQHLIFSWTDNGNKPDAPRKYAVIESNRIVTGSSKAIIIAALAAIDGTAPNHSASQALPESGAASNATFLQITARQMDFLGSNPNATLFKMARRLKFQASETDEQLNAVLVLEAGDEITAKQMSIVAQGFVALLTLQKDNPKTARLATGLSVKQDGSTVTVTLFIPSIDLIAAIKEYTAKKAAKE